MSLRVLQCPQCGASLDIGDGVEAIRCRFCGARSQVEGQGTSQHLSLLVQKLDRLEAHAVRTAEEIEAIRHQKTLGLASQLTTDEAVRRAAMAQEEAARNAAYISGIEIARHEAQVRAAHEYLEHYERERNRLLDLKAKFIRIRRRSNLAFLSLLFLFITPLILMLVSPGELESLRGFMFWASLFALAYGWLSRNRSNAIGTQFNSVAHNVGLPMLSGVGGNSAMGKAATAVITVLIGCGFMLVSCMALTGTLSVLTTNRPSNEESPNVVPATRSGTNSDDRGSGAHSQADDSLHSTPADTAPPTKEDSPEPEPGSVEPGPVEPRTVEPSRVEPVDGP